MNNMSENIHEVLSSAVDGYAAPRDALNFVAEHPPVILCGITSAGKDTVAHELAAGGGYELVVSHTTREPRENHGVIEHDGVDYFFVSKEQMLELVNDGAFFEVKNVHHNVYGTSIAALSAPYEKGNKAILVIDFQGALEFVSFVPDLRPIFLLPPTLAIWRQRLDGRGRLPDEEFHKRLQSAQREIKTALENTAFHLLVNYEKPDTALAIRKNLLGRDRGAVDVAELLLYQITEELKR